MFMENLGFTGTRHGMTQAQRKTVSELMHELPVPRYVHHGDCVGADAEFHRIARSIYGPEITFIGHPSVNQKYRAYTDCDVWREPFPYLVRDDNIVIECDFLIACSWTPHEIIRSGTWATIRKARKLDKPHKIVLPDGSLHVRRG